MSARRGGPSRLAFGPRRLAFLFLISALPTGLGLALLTPIGQVADEPAHIARADGLLDGQILGRRLLFINPDTGSPFPYAGVLVSEPILQASLAELVLGPAAPVPAERLRDARAIRWNGRIERDICSNTVPYFPSFYLSGAAGIALAHVLGGSPLQALYAGRIGMLASYLAMGAAALTLAAWGGPILFVLLSLPMTLSLGASFNQDGQLIAAAALAAALLTRDPQRNPKAPLLALVLLALVACSKPPYGLLLLATATPLAVPGLWRRLGRVLLASLAPLAWTAVMLRVSLVPFHRPFYHPGPLWPGSRSVLMQGTSPVDNLRVLLARPSEFVLLPVRFLAHEWLDQIHSAIGVLGWLTIVLPWWQYLGWMLAAIAAAAATLFTVGTGEARAWRGGDAAFVVLLVIASVWAMEISIYLSWTEVGAATITGPVGRYYLPIAPFLVFLLPPLGLRLDQRFGAAGVAGFLLTLPCIAMAAIDIFYLPHLVGKIFHLN